MYIRKDRTLHEYTSCQHNKHNAQTDKTESLPMTIVNVGWNFQVREPKHRDNFVLTDTYLHLEPVSPQNRAKSGKIGHFETFEV